MTKRTGLLVLVGLLSGCGSTNLDEFGDYGGGATPGGAKDISYARELIESGEVPPGEVISVEGLLSEHDLPAVGPACESLLCSRPAVGVAPSFETGEPAIWLQLGMATGLPAELARPPLDLVVAIDKSDSMSIDMTETTEAVARLIGKLGPDDRLAILTFDDTVRELHAFGPVTDPDGLAAQVRAIRAGGGWDIQTAVDRAYEIAARSVSAERLERVMVFSCGYPPLSDDHSDSFSQLVLAGGADGVGMSFFGVLLGYADTLGDLLGDAHGGAYYYLEDLARVEEVFDRDFDLGVTPLAYDLRFDLDLGDGYRIDRVYGVPGDEAGEPRVALDVATAFPSRRGGGLVARLTRRSAGDPAIGEVSLSYRPEPALGWSASEDQRSAVAMPWSDDGPHYEGIGVQKAAFLVNQAEGMIAACDAWHRGDQAEARDALERLLALMRPEAEQIGGAEIAAEVALVDKLLANMD